MQTHKACTFIWHCYTISRLFFLLSEKDILIYKPKKILKINSFLGEVKRHLRL